MAYPARYTPHIGLSLYGFDEVIIENFSLIDTAYGAGSSINVNGSLVTAPNFNGTLPVAPFGEQLVTFQFDANGNISAYVPIPAAGGVTSFSGDSVVYNNALSAGAVTLSLIAQAAKAVFAGPATGANATPTFRALVATDIPALAYVTSVAMTGDGVIFNSTVTGSPITSSGTLVPALLTQTANTVFAGPVSAGPTAPTFRALVSADLASTIVLANGITATTQTTGDNTAKLATDAFVNASITAIAAPAWANLTGTLSNGQVIPYGDAGISRLGAASLAIGNGTAGDTSGTLTLRQVYSAQYGGVPSGMTIFYPSNAYLSIESGGTEIVTFSASVGTGGGGEALKSTYGLMWSSGAPSGANPDTGIFRLGAASLAIGNGTAGDVTGKLTLKSTVLSDFGSAPTSAGTAGTVGQIVQHSGVLYFCSVTGAGGGATQWNTITLVPIL